MFCQRGERGGQRSETVREVELAVLMSIKSKAERKEHDRARSATCLKQTQSHTNRLKWKSSMGKAEGSLCVWMGVWPAELGEAEEVEVQYKTGRTECEGP